MDLQFVSLLDRARDIHNQPWNVSSGYRCPRHNSRVSSTGESGPHTTGQAVDILASGGNALRIVEIALDLGFTGIGLKQKGEHSRRFIHLDTLPNAPGQPRPWIWTY